MRGSAGGWERGRGRWVNLSSNSPGVGPAGGKPRMLEAGEGGGWVRKEGAGKWEEVTLPRKLHKDWEGPPNKTGTSRKLYSVST